MKLQIEVFVDLSHDESQCYG